MYRTKLILIIQYLIRIKSRYPYSGVSYMGAVCANATGPRLEGAHYCSNTRYCINWKALGSDSIPSELIKYGGEDMYNFIYRICHRV
ncbi:Craniofacial development protein 2 [Aphis craccivora]|uniref:Craniofacial development protein 2 n=1 Tax=Aphis craccivora TaxID=307492 RepID=A0A6G0VYC7_APHCR|nr:Craniofacial development protein 2 [Aphis craccivora]